MERGGKTTEADQGRIETTFRAPTRYNDEWKSSSIDDKQVDFFSNTFPADARTAHFHYRHINTLHFLRSQYSASKQRINLLSPKL
jgi:hypothetical protein